MGLDSVELVMRLEDAFHITIKDQEAEGIRTLGDLFALVRLKTAGLPEDRCLTSHIFYKLRQAIRDTTPNPARFGPRTLLNEALPLESRRTLWTKLAAASGLNLPDLSRSTQNSHTIAAFAAIGGTSMAVIAGCHVSPVLATVSGIITFAFLCWLLGRLTQSQLRHIPSVHTLGDLARLTLCRNFPSAILQINSIHHRELWNAITHILAEELKIPAADLRAETRLIEDLGL